MSLGNIQNIAAMLVYKNSLQMQDIEYLKVIGNQSQQVGLLQIHQIYVWIIFKTIGQYRDDIPGGFHILSGCTEMTVDIFNNNHIASYPRQPMRDNSRRKRDNFQAVLCWIGLTKIYQVCLQVQIRLARTPTQGIKVYVILNFKINIM